MLGSKLSHILSKKGFKIIATYNTNEEFVPRGDNIENINLDITKDIHNGRLKSIDAIIHCAGVTEVNLCELNKTICRKVNVDGTKNIINLAKLYDAKFIFISTPMVFSGKEGDYKEEDRVDPINYYGQTKADAEKLVLQYNKGLVLRVNPIGRRPLGAHPSFMQWFVDMATNNRSFSLFTDVIINPISTSTLSNIIGDLIVDFNPGTLHLGSRDKVNKADIWEEVVKSFPNYSGTITKISVNKTHAGKIASRPHKMWLNVEKSSKFGYPMPLWKTEVSKVLEEITK